MSESNGRILVVKQWHVLLTFVGWLVLAVLAYASVKSQGEENARQIQEMKQQNVQKEQYQEFQQDIQRRLQRIEDKIDRDHDRRAAH